MDSLDHAFDGIPRVSFAEGTIVLGVPSGSDDFTAKFISSHHEKQDKRLRRAKSRCNCVLEISVSVSKQNKVR